MLLFLQFVLFWWFVVVLVIFNPIERTVAEG